MMDGDDSDDDDDDDDGDDQEEKDLLTSYSSKVMFGPCRLEILWLQLTRVGSKINIVVHNAFYL